MGESVVHEPCKIPTTSAFIGKARVSCHATVIPCLMFFSSLYVNRKSQKDHYEATRPETSYRLKPLEDLFKGDAIEKVVELEKSKTAKTSKKMVNGNSDGKGVSNFQNGFEVSVVDDSELPRIKRKKANRKVLGGKIKKFQKK